MWTLVAVGCAVGAVGALVALTVRLMRHLVCKPQRSMQGEVVLLTGAGGGLGRQLALQLARAGCPLALVDVVEHANEKTASLVRAAAPHLQVHTYVTDLSERDDIAALLERVFEDFGRIDVLLSNAAMLVGGGVCDYSDDEVDGLLSVNLRATMLLVRGVLPRMRTRRSGRLVAIGSAAGITPNHGMSLYGATKAGLSHFMQCLYRELRMDGLEEDIVVTTVHPFFMSTFDELVDAQDIKGWLAWLTPFMEPSWCALKIVESIARGAHYVTIPYHAKLGMLLTTLLPVCLLNFVLEKVVRLTFKSFPRYEYRHAQRDIHLLHKYLSEGLELTSDPERLFQAMDDECKSRGLSRPYDFTGFKDSLETFYKKREKAVPDIVRKYISTEHN